MVSLLQTNARLNMDILHATIDLMDEAVDVRSLSLTRSALRPLAARKLLGSCAQSYSETSLIRSFHAFILADPVMRPRYIPTLYLDVLDEGERAMTSEDDREEDNPQESQRSCICAILAYLAPHLQQLRVKNYESSQDEDGILCQAIAKFSSLKELYMHCYTLHDSAVMKQIQLPLRFLRAVYSISLYNNTYWSPPSVNNCVAHLAPTLEVLEVDTFVHATGWLP